MITVTTFLWHEPRDKYAKLYHYGPDHVHRLRSMLARHLDLPHEVVCITNAPEGLDPNIRTIPLDERLIAPNRRYPKLMAFRPDVAQWLGERILVMDLDTVITDDITPLVDRPEDIVLWRNVDWGRVNDGPPWNTSLFLLTAGARPQVWDSFPDDHLPTPQKRGSDQWWVGHVLGPDEACWDAFGADGIHLALHILRRRDKAAPPEGCRLVSFAGPRDPSMPEMQKQLPWIKEHWR